MIKWIAAIVFWLFILNGYAQQLSAFHDYRRYLMVFDNGKIKELDHLPAQSFQVGGKCIPFISNTGQFKVYYNGNIITLADQSVSKYYASPDLMIFLQFDQLFVFDDGITTMLSSHVTNFASGDSIVAFFNENTYCSQVYYKGNIYTLEKSLVGNPVIEFSAGDNLIAYYNDNTKYLKSFYNGKMWNILQSSSKIAFQAGRNMLAYIDYAKNSFHVFYKGELFDLEDYEPKSFKVGDDLMAYIDNLGEFKVFYNGENQSITPFEPDFYEVKDSLVVFSEKGYFKVFYKGKVSEYGFYVPEEFQAQESTMAFIGPNGWLHAFTNGQFIKVTNDLITSYAVNCNIININTTIKKIKIFYRGRIYDTN
jgi:hypothetical protein